MMNFDADIDVFFDDFAQLVSYVHDTDEAREVSVIFDDVSKVSDVGVAVSTKAPSVQCKTKEVPDLTEGDTFTIHELKYCVVEPVQKEYGITRAHLMRTT